MNRKYNFAVKSIILIVSGIFCLSQISWASDWSFIEGEAKQDSKLPILKEGFKKVGDAADIDTSLGIDDSTTKVIGIISADPADSIARMLEIFRGPMEIIQKAADTFTKTKAKTSSFIIQQCWISVPVKEYMIGVILEMINLDNEFVSVDRKAEVIKELDAIALNPDVEISIKEKMVGPLLKTATWKAGRDIISDNMRVEAFKTIGDIVKDPNLSASQKEEIVRSLKEAYDEWSPPMHDDRGVREGISVVLNNLNQSLVRKK